MPAVVSSELKYLGPVAANHTECLSVGAKIYKLAANEAAGLKANTRKSGRKGRSIPLSTSTIGSSAKAQEYCYYLIVFHLSFSTYDLVFNKLAPCKAELQISLQNGYIASDGAPLIERHLKSIRIKYSYGSKIESSSGISFKLGWEDKDSPASAATTGEKGEKLTNDYSVILETEAVTRNCTVQFVKPVSSSPKWIFERHPNEQILQDTREVWLMIEAPASNPLPLNATAILSAKFTIVREKEILLEKKTRDRNRLYDKVMLASIRTWFEKPKNKKDVSINIQNFQ